LIKEKIAFKLECGTLSNGYTSAAIQIIASDIKLSFALPENGEEDSVSGESPSGDSSA
jgi:hypothetical protein